MSRHRDVRSMNYSDEYDGYDDVYGHSVDDDYGGVSPDAQEFLFDRNKRQNISSFLTQPSVTELNEDEARGEGVASLPISELERAKLASCMEAVKSVVGETVSSDILAEKIMEHDYDAEIVLDAILKETERTALAETSRPFDQHGQKVAELQASWLNVNVGVGRGPSVKVTTATSSRSIVKGFEVIDTESARGSRSPGSDRRSPDPKSNKDEFTERLTVTRTETPLRRSPASLGGSSTPEPAESAIKINREKRDVSGIYRDKRGDAKQQLHLVVVGHVDAGKSTLLGRLLCDVGQVSTRVLRKYQQDSKKIGKQSFAYAWVLDETGEERERGITMDVGHAKFETETKSVSILDAPGHRDFIPNMITGATQADVALLVVDATRGEFETGFDSGGQTREHALLLRSLGIAQLAVVVNKLDTVDWSEERFDEIVEKMRLFLKQAGFGDSIAFVPCSGLSGENIVSKPTAEALSKWYSGPTLLNVIDNFLCPERPIEKPFRFSVNDIPRGTSSGVCVSGHVETGMVAVGDKVLLSPANETAVVKAIRMDEISTSESFAGDHVTLSLAGIDNQNVAVGDIICSPLNPIPVTTCFQAHVVVFATAVPIIRGLPVAMHQQSLVEPATITKLIAHLHKSTGQVMKKKPRCLPKNCSAVIEITTQRPVPMELYKDVKQLGRVMLRVSGATIAAGLVTKIK